MQESKYREQLKDRKRIVIKIGSSSLVHEETGTLNFTKIERLVRELSDLRNQGKDVVLVSSGAIAVGTNTLRLPARPDQISQKQACASVGQAKLMMTYQRIFSEYNQVVGQVLMTKNTILNPVARKNTQNTFEQSFAYGVIPIVNENDTVSTYEMQFGDNDTLSALVASLIDADLLILLSDIDGLYTDNPRSNPDAQMLTFVERFDEKIAQMASDKPGSSVGTGGMKTKLIAAEIAMNSGADMLIANAADVGCIHRIFEGAPVGTLFQSRKNEDFYIADYIEKTMN
jgi:glutamate 5-kinase